MTLTTRKSAIRPNPGPGRKPRAPAPAGAARRGPSARLWPVKGPVARCVAADPARREHQLSCQLTMDQSELRDIPIADAQAEATFTVLVPSPGALPADCELSPTASLRAERPPRDAHVPQWGDCPLQSNELHAVGWTSGGTPPWTTMRNCCVVLSIPGADRALRLKQYLFLDYGPHPTHHAMIPPVGTYSAKAAAAPGPRTEFEIGRRACGWLGVDYAGMPCAQLMLRGTCVEVRVTRGSFSDDELIGLCASLRPVAETGYPTQSFAKATYYARFPTTCHGFLVPSSLWAADVSNFGLPHCAFPVWGAADAAPEQVPKRLGRDLLLDSFGVLGGNKNSSSSSDGAEGHGAWMETLALYCNESRDAMLWVRAVRAVGPREEAPLWPPAPGAYPCQVPMHKCDSSPDLAVFTAHVTRLNGPHDCAFRRLSHGSAGCTSPSSTSATTTTYVHATPRPGFDISHFCSIISEICGTKVSESVAIAPRPADRVG